MVSYLPVPKFTRNGAALTIDGGFAATQQVEIQLTKTNLCRLSTSRQTCANAET
jgi:hypothetical protein